MRAWWQNRLAPSPVRYGNVAVMSGSVGADVDTRPVLREDLSDLARLFETHGPTRGCWCMAFAGEPVGRCACDPGCGTPSRPARAARSCAIVIPPKTKPPGCCHASSSGSDTKPKESSTPWCRLRWNRPAVRAPSPSKVGHAGYDPADAYLGREKLFEELGFSCVGRPSPQRVIMRLELRSA